MKKVGLAMVVLALIASALASSADARGRRESRKIHHSHAMSSN